MIVVTDTSPLNYLILIGVVNVLPSVFGTVIVPEAALFEMQHPNAPDQVRMWATNPPAWLEVRTVGNFTPFEDLGPGESEAIALAQQIGADQVLIDDREAVNVARQLGLSVVGTLGVLELAAKKGLIILQDAISELGETSFRAQESLIAELLERDEARKSKPSDSNNHD